MVGNIEEPLYRTMRPAFDVTERLLEADLPVGESAANEQDQQQDQQQTASGQPVAKTVGLRAQSNKASLFGIIFMGTAPPRRAPKPRQKRADATIADADFKRGLVSGHQWAFRSPIRSP